MIVHGSVTDDATWGASSTTARCLLDLSALADMALRLGVPRKRVIVCDPKVYYDMLSRVGRVSSWRTQPLGVPVMVVYTPREMYYECRRIARAGEQVVLATTWPCANRIAKSILVEFTSCSGSVSLSGDGK